MLEKKLILLLALLLCLIALLLVCITATVFLKAILSLLEGFLKKDEYIFLGIILMMFIIYMLVLCSMFYVIF